MRTEIIDVLQTSGDIAMATWRIRRRMRGSVLTRRVRAELVRMERAGIVRRHVYSTVNNTVWQLVEKGAGL